MCPAHAIAATASSPDRPAERTGSMSRGSRDHAAFARTRTGPKARRGRDADPVGKRVVRDPRVVGEHLEDPLVDSSKPAEYCSMCPEPTGARANIYWHPGDYRIFHQSRSEISSDDSFSSVSHCDLEASMRVGVPASQEHEYRVAITPSGVQGVVRNGHEVVLEHDAGVGSSLRTRTTSPPARTILPSADDVWASADLVLR